MEDASETAELRTDVARPPEYMEYLEKATNAMRTIRMVVYAGMASFVVLAFYGFFLIYQLTSDAHSAVEHMSVMTRQMQSMTQTLASLQGTISTMGSTVATMDGHVGAMDGHVGSMSTDMRQINQTMAQMQNSVGHISRNVGMMSQDLTQIGNTVSLMQHSARNLDQSIGPMMGTMNQMMPFGWPGGSYGGAPPFAPPMR